MIDIKGLPKAKLLAALYNGSKPQGLGHLVADKGRMTEDQALSALHQGPYFDYLKGRVMKVSIAGDKLDPFLYDRENGPGAAEREINTCR